MKRLYIFFLYNLFFTSKGKFAFPFVMFQDLRKLELRILQKQAKEAEKQEKEKRLAKLRQKVIYHFFILI